MPVEKVRSISAPACPLVQARWLLSTDTCMHMQCRHWTPEQGGSALMVVNILADVPSPFCLAGCPRRVRRTRRNTRPQENSKQRQDSLPHTLPTRLSTRQAVSEINAYKKAVHPLWSQRLIARPLNSCLLTCALFSPIYPKERYQHRKCQVS